MTKFNSNIRSTDSLDDSELRTAMKGGWDKELPAIKDEHGVVLVGHRRLKIAEEEGIDPVIKVVAFGDGPEAEAARIRLANVSNIGGAPLTREDRQRQAERLYDGGRGLTMEAIGHMLGVNKATISRDLETLLHAQQCQRESKTDTLGRKASTGRPKKTREPKTPPSVEEAAASLVLDKGKTQGQAATELGIPRAAVRIALNKEEGKREKESDPTVTPDMLSMTAKEKLEAAIRQHKRKMDIEFDHRVRQKLVEYIDTVWLPSHRSKLAEAKRVIEARRGVMDRATYRKILSCLHPDRVSDEGLKKRYEEAFNCFTKLELVLLPEREMPTGADVVPLPNSAFEFMEAKRQATEERKKQKS